MENKKPPPSQQPAKVPEDVKDKKAKEEPTVAPAKAEVKKQEIKKETSRSSEESSPKILGGQINCDAIETDDYVLEFKGSGVPNPKVVWTKNGEEVKDTDRIKAVQEDDTFKLILNNIQMEDDGEYECLLENRLGSESIKGVVKVTKIDEVLHPKIKPWLENQVIIEDDCGTLSCKVYGSPAPEITWFKDDQEIENSDHIRAYSEHDDPREKRLKLNVVKEQDMGQYKIVARNVHGEVDSEAHVEITWKPKIKGLRHLDKVTVDYGDDVSIAATVSANPKSDVVWKHNGVELPKGDAVRGYEEDGDTYTLVIKAADYRRDDGKYTLHARNELGETVDGFELEVHTIKPYFKLALENASAPLGAPLTLLARIDGLPKPTATWYKEGVEVTESTPGITLNFEEGFHELKIERIEEAFLCKYTIVGTSDVGECTSSGEVTCDTHPPLIEGQLRKVNRLHEGDTLTLEAVAKGSPIPVITWYKDGVPIEPDGERIVATSQPDGTQVLVVKNVTPDDEGEYKLAARNKFGEVSSPSHVEVKGAPDKPHFVKELGDVTAVLGMPVDLVAQVKGCPKPRTKWFKDGKPIHGGFLNDPDGTTTFHISWPKVEDVGTYSIVATNDSGEAESVGTLKLEGAAGPPKILAPMKNARAVEGYPVKLETTVSGHPLPEIVWMKGDDIIEPDGVRVRAVVEPNGTVALIIDEAQLKDTGDYTLIAKNPQGEDKRRVKLVVLDKFKDGEAEAEPYFKTPLKDVTIPEGSELRLIADIIGNPLPDVVWKRNGEPIEKGGDVKVAFDGKKVGLIAPCVRRADAGEFECCLKNPLGEAKSSCQVSIEKTYEAPTWTQKFSDQQQMPGFDANLAGRVSGVPCPDVTWSKDGEVLREGARIKMKRDGELAVLFIQDCRESDSGFYEAVAKNCEGTADCSASLTVVPKVDHGPKAEPPSFLKKIGDCEVYERMPARFTACVMGNPEPEFEWFKDDVKLQPSDRIHFEKEGSGLLRLAIDHATVEDAGRYKLNIWNEHGNAWCEAELSFDGLDASRPKPRGDGDHWVLEPLKDAPIISRMTDRQLKLSWRPSVPHGPRDPVTYKVEIKDEPGGDWKPLRSGVMSCAMEVRNLLPHADYSFRVSVESKYGVSDPSPVATTSRGVLAPRPAAERLHLEPGTEFNPEISPYFPADFDLERPPHDKYTAAPKYFHTKKTFRRIIEDGRYTLQYHRSFLRQQFDKQYGIKNQPTNIRWFVYGYPKPEVKWFFNDQPVEMGGRFSFSYTRNGCATLFINGMLERDVGLYECIATNEHGKASQRVDVALAEHPKFLTQLTETHALARDSFRLECHLVGVPYPDVKWFKDWQPIAASNRIKVEELILWNEPDRCTLVVNDCIAKDAGLYSCTGTNMAGTASTSCSVYIEEDVKDYDWKTYKKPYPFSSYKRPLRDLYDLGKELGRGTQGIIQHAVERSTGQTFAAKSMKGFDHFHDMENEAKIMQGLTHPHLCRLFDLFDEGDVMTLVTDIGGGGDLFEWISNQPHVNEYEIAHFIRQVLEGLKHMHDREIAHLGLTPGDIFLTRPNGDEIKIGDFGLAKTLHGGRLIALDYGRVELRACPFFLFFLGIGQMRFVVHFRTGMPEFVAPEIASKSDNVGLPADMWAVGLMTYLYLSGLSPFRGRDDVETLENVKGGQYSLDIDPFPNLSPECRDFIKKMLVYDPKGRLNVAAALEHPWLKLPMPKEPFLIPTDRHKMAFRDYRDWNDNAKCRDQFRRNPLSGAYLHPSRMVYPPRVPDIPYETPDYDARHVSPLDTSIPMPDSESHYQQGPDTYLLQLRDSDFPSRLRRYMKVAADRSPSFALRLRQDNYMANPTVRERRKFRDISDEEVKEEKSGAGEGRYRLKYEPGYNLDAKKDAEAYLETKRSGKAPFFREKLQPRALVEDEEAVLSCLALGDPKPVVHFFRNGFLVTPNNRILIETDSDGRTLLKFTAAEPGDAGIFRAVARNKLGEVACFTRFVVLLTLIQYQFTVLARGPVLCRFLIGHKPACPDIPQVTNVSDTEVLLKWTAPHEDGVSRVLCYALEAKEDEEDSEWQLVAENIDHEFYCVRNLKPETPFIFRLCARNKYGWGPKSMTSDVVTTKEAEQRALVRRDKLSRKPYPGTAI
ncbi:unnamed protein product [Cyprideis torosa]|uniref:Uncharacterized protein n=1 Tax=Cyprideis torosa TaxID=163714 RepID=A0A7R8ZK56_9CRUS|nr:unnamed protein product [Cyprideis torosa]CAG0879559.1 unnamed protein product [Cyprideis torosa]